MVLWAQPSLNLCCPPDPLESIKILIMDPLQSLANLLKQIISYIVLSTQRPTPYFYRLDHFWKNCLSVSTIFQLYLTEVQHWKLLGISTHIINESQSRFPQNNCRLNQSKIRLYKNSPICTIPWQQHFFNNNCTISKELISCILISVSIILWHWHLHKFK